MEQPGENLVSALRDLLDRLHGLLAVRNIVLTNENLEASPGLHTLIDGIDSQSANPLSQAVLRTVFQLRATRVANIRAAGRLGWIRETGARMRMIETVETDLLNQFAAWETLDNPTDEQFVNVILEWAWDHGYLADDIRKAYRLEAKADLAGVRDSFFVIIRRWLMGDTFAEIAGASATAVDDTLAIYTGAISYGLQTIVEQGISLLSKLLESQGRLLAESVRSFPEHLRFGAPTAAACVLSKSGIRHRRAAILLGETREVSLAVAAPRAILFNSVRQMLEGDEAGWRDRLGTLMYENTIADVA